MRLRKHEKALGGMGSGEIFKVHGPCLGDKVAGVESKNEGIGFSLGLTVRV
jgi:hypothetical protein